MATGQRQEPDQDAGTDEGHRHGEGTRGQQAGQYGTEQQREPGEQVEGVTGQLHDPRDYGRAGDAGRDLSPGGGRESGRVRVLMTVGWDDVLVTLHVLGATVWVGGQLVLAGLVPVLRRAAPAAVPLAARAYGRLAWPAFALLVATGALNVVTVAHGDAAYWRTLTVKLALVLLSGATAFAHQRVRGTAARAATAATSLGSALVVVLLGVVLGGHG